VSGSTDLQQGWRVTRVFGVVMSYRARRRLRSWLLLTTNLLREHVRTVDRLLRDLGSERSRRGSEETDREQ